MKAKLEREREILFGDRIPRVYSLDAGMGKKLIIYSHVQILQVAFVRFLFLFLFF
jgi:hypothetical protein